MNPLLWLEAYNAPLSEMDRSNEQSISTQLTSTAPKSTVFLYTINKHTRACTHAHMPEIPFTTAIKKYSRNKAPKSLTFLE